MSLIPKWAGKIILPEIAVEKKKIGANYVSQIFTPALEIEVELFDAQLGGFDLIKTRFPKPFDQILLKRKRSRVEIPEKLLVLAPRKKYDLTTLSVNTEFHWLNIPFLPGIPKTAYEIADSWSNKFQFRSENDETGELGLRPPQLGALHAIAAHFSTGEIVEPATIVLPTGTGKTETMLSALAYLQLSKLLVLVPKKALRDQIYAKFQTFGILPIINALPFDILRPRVALIKQGLKSSSEAKTLIDNINVLIATPNILSSSDPEAVNILFNECTDLFIDEAHHASASTWENVRNRFLSKRITQFTATPFRNDKKHIGGKIIYNYKLGQAQKAQYYKNIRFHPVDEYGGLQEGDMQIALKALEILKDDLQGGYDHLMMARVDKTERANEIHKLYSELAPQYSPVIVHSKLSKTSNDESLRKLWSRESRIVVCVDMLGEGFDLPNLKIAAIHDGHRSLTITLQFIGRFTRKSKAVGDAAVVINIADQDTEENLKKLYSTGADWDFLIKRLSEEKIDRIIRLQEVINDLKEKGNLHEEVSLWNLRPSLSAQLYITENEDWFPENFSKALPSNLKYWYSISEKNNMLVVLGVHETQVKWGYHEGLNDIIHKILIAYWIKEKSAFFIYSNDFEGLRITKIVEEIFDGKAKLFSGKQIFNILNNVELPLVKNLGASRVGVISFTQYFGPNVTDGLAAIEKNQSELSNLACLGYENGERVIWGGAQRKGKIWSMKNGSIEEWMEWCQKTWSKVSSEEQTENITKDFLRPIQLLAPYDKPSISILWGEHLYLKNAEKTFVMFGQHEEPLFNVEINLSQIGSVGDIKFQISTEEQKSEYVFRIDSSQLNGYLYTHISGNPISFKYGNGSPKPLEEHAILDPFIIQYSDGTYSYNNYHINSNLNAGQYNKDEIEVWDWAGIPLNQESMGKEKNEKTIQFRSYQHIEDYYELIINDDGKGEAGDLVCFKSIDDNKILLMLVHCKNAKGGKPSGDIENLYTVCGQAQKSVRVKHSGIYELVKNLLRRNARWAKEGKSRFLKGDKQKLEYFRNRSRTSKLEFEIVIVQPGLSVKLLTEDMLRLLGTTELYLKKTAQASFRVIGHQ